VVAILALALSLLAGATARDVGIVRRIVTSGSHG
jgi:hypothetical protein